METRAADNDSQDISADLEVAPLEATAALVEALETGIAAEQILAAAHAADLVVPGQLLRADVVDAGWTQAGAGVEQCQAGWRVQRLGYVHCADGQVQVVHPILIDSAGNVACLLLLEGRRRLPVLTEAALRAALEGAGVRYGVMDTVIAELCDDPKGANRRAPGAVIVAQSSPPVHGRDGDVHFAVDLARRAGRLQEDGSIDLRERNSAIAVLADQEVARVTQPAPGEDGCDVRGGRLPATQGLEAQLEAGDNVRLARADDGAEVFVSEIDGNLAVEVGVGAGAGAGTGVVHVRTLFTVTADVDYDVGNIDVPGDVQVQGAVLAGFSVQAGGSIAVSGTVEPGAILRAGADILVGQGILGARTRVVAGGSVTTKFIQNSLVAAGTDVTVGSYIFSGRVHAGTGCVLVENRGGERGGSIVGGQVLAGTRVDTHRLGSADTDRTLAGIAVEPTLTATVSRLRKAHQQLTGQLQASLSKLAITSPNDRQQLARLLSRTPADRLDAVEVQLKQVRADLQQAEQLQAQIDEITSKTQQQLACGRIRVRRAVHADVQVQFGSDIRQLTEAIPGDCELYVAGGKIRWRAAHDPQDPTASDSDP